MSSFDMKDYKTPNSSPPTLQYIQKSNSIKIPKLPKMDSKQNPPPLPPDLMEDFEEDFVELQDCLPKASSEPSMDQVQPKRRFSVDTCNSSVMEKPIPKSASANNSGSSTPRSISMSPFRHFLQSSPSFHSFSMPSSPKKMVGLSSMFSTTLLTAPIQYHECIGNGGAARIFDADIQGCNVAIKLYHQLVPSSCVSKELELETKKIAIQQSFDHEHVLKTFGHRFVVNIEKNEHFLAVVMEKMEGSLKSFLEKMDRQKDLTPPVVKNWFGQIVSGIGYLHSLHFVWNQQKFQGIWHRDVKCENILYRKQCNVFDSATDNTNLLLKIADFDTMSFEEIGDNESNVGTGSFMAPEMFVTDLVKTCKIDIWSLGMVLFEIVTNRIPYEGYSFFDIGSIAFQGVRPTFPSELTHLQNNEWDFWMTMFRDCTNKNPDCRPSASALASKIANYNFISTFGGKS